MPTITRSSLPLCVVSCIVLAVALPAAARAQNTTIPVSATVQPRPLMLVDAALTAVPGELRVRVDGCGSGALSVDVRTADATRRTSRAVLGSTSICTTRTVLVRLPTTVTGAQAFVVTLEQSQSLISPAFAQFVVPASSVATRPSVAY